MTGDLHPDPETAQALARIDEWATYLAYMHDQGLSDDISVTDYRWRRTTGELRGWHEEAS